MGRRKPMYEYKKILVLCRSINQSDRQIRTLSDDLPRNIRLEIACKVRAQRRIRDHETCDSGCETEDYGC